MDEGTSCGDVERGSLLQPYMAVDSGAFIEPSFLKRCVAAYADEVGLLRTVAEKQIIRDVVVLMYVSAWLDTYKNTIDPDLSVAEDSVKL